MPVDDALRCQKGQLLGWRGVTFFAVTPQKHFISRLRCKSHLARSTKLGKPSYR